METVLDFVIRKLLVVNGFRYSLLQQHTHSRTYGLHVEQKHILHGKLDDDKDEQEMNKEIAELLKSNRKIINITPEDIIDIEETDESKQLSPPLTPTKTKSDPDSTS